MKPFNLEAALSGEKIVTRRGMPISSWVHWPDATAGSRILALHHDRTVTTHFENGMVYPNRSTSDYDLFLSEDCPKKFTRWINIYRDPYCDERVAATRLYVSEEQAAKAANSDCLRGLHVTALKVEWEEP